MTHDAFLKDIVENPDDVSLRLIYADWLEERGDPRGEFIRVQCRLAHLPRDDAKRSELEVRERQLLEEHEVEWTEPLRGLVRKACLRRGFVEHIELEAMELLDHENVIFSRAPVQSVKLGPVWQHRNEIYRRLNRCSSLSRLSSFHLHHTHNSINDSELQDLAWRVLLLQRLTDFYAWDCDVSEAGLEPVLASNQVLRLRRLFLPECDLTSVLPLVASSSLIHLSGLSLPRNDLGDRGAATLAEWPGCCTIELLDLEGCGFSDEGVAALARSPYLTRLTHFFLGETPITDRGADALILSPHLGQMEYLRLDGNAISEGCQKRLVARFGERVEIV